MVLSRPQSSLVNMSDDSRLKIKPLGGDSSTGVKVLFIHGFGADRQSWAGNAPAVFDFAESLALDLPGHGLSVSIKGCHDLQTVADLVMQSAGDDQPLHLVGHSVGAAVAVLCAASKPANILSLSLIAPLGLGQGVSKTFSDNLADLDNETDALNLLQSLVHNKRLIAGALAQLLLAHLNKPGARESLKDFAGLLHKSDKQLHSAFAKVASNDLKRQVFWGKQDSINPMNANDVIVFGGDWHYLEDCGHLPHVEHRTFFNNKLCEFLKSNKDS